MPLARTFRDLHAYQKARAAAHHIFRLTASFPKEERYALTDQIRRSSRAVGAILAEGWTRRHYQKVFRLKLDEAKAEARETQAWLDSALDCQYINHETHESLDNDWNHIAAMLQKMIDRSSDFCSHDFDPPS